MSSVAIVGAGIAGLACARALADHGLRVTVFEKSRGPGGRTSTRRAGDSRWDHGAPSFHAGDPRFLAQVGRWQEEGVAFPLGAGLWIATPSAHAVAKRLADGLDVRTGVRIEALDDARAGHDAVVLAVPAPQAVPLLEPGHPWHARLESVRYEGQFALLARWDPAPSIPIHDARIDAGPLARAVRRPDGPGDCWVLHGRATTEFDRDPERAGDELLDAFRAATGLDLPEPAERSVHRWRYARCVAPLGEDFCWDAEARLGLCGDGIRGDGIESAWLSGTALAGALL